ncbi:MAG: hypothetical protein HFH90_15520 [Lachnospiraceae bacterium]|jgi:hypothetical protein|nr:hypothetical protein [Lachnospiraceae bacterium]
MNTEGTALHKLSSDTCVPWDASIAHKKDVFRTTEKWHRLQKGGCDHGSR